MVTISSQTVALPKKDFFEKWNHLWLSLKNLRKCPFPFLVYTKLQCVFPRILYANTLQEVLAFPTYFEPLFSFPVKKCLTNKTRRKRRKEEFFSWAKLISALLVWETVFLCLLKMKFRFDPRPLFGGRVGSNVKNQTES